MIDPYFCRHADILVDLFIFFYILIVVPRADAREPMWIESSRFSRFSFLDLACLDDASLSNKKSLAHRL
jgi:hypothetical protein